MLKLLIVVLVTALLVAIGILYLVHSDTSSKKDLLKYIGFGTICLVLAALLLGAIVVLF